MWQPEKSLGLRVLVLVGYPLSRVLLLFHRHESTAITFYFDWVSEVLRGRTPYAEIPIEYPPAAWLFIRAVSAADWSTFVDRFRWTSAAFEVAAFVLFLSIVRRHWPHRFWLMAASYVLCTTALEQLLYENLDAGLLLLLMGWIWLRVGPRSHATAASLASHGVLGLAIAFKVLPVVLVPFALIQDWQRLGAAAAARGAAVLLLGCALPFLMLWPSAGTTPFLFVRAHLDRGLEFGSIWASFLWVLSVAGLPMSTSPTGRVIEIAAPGARALARLAPCVSLAIGGGLAIWSARRGTGGEVADTSLAIGALAGAVGTSVVLSPQFFIWLCPLLIVAGSGLFDDRRFRVYAAVVVGAAVTTALVWPVLFRELHDMRPVPWALLAVRNVLVVVATVWLIRAAMSAPRSTR